MALNKINLVRLKSGSAPSDRDLITYDSSSLLYNTISSGEFISSVVGQIKTSEIYNDQPFLDPTTESVKNARVENDTIIPINQTLDLGSSTDLVFPHGAYSSHWVSSNEPLVASGKDGDLWFVIA
jgi:hypothetical protein